VIGAIPEDPFDRIPAEWNFYPEPKGTTVSDTDEITNYEDILDSRDIIARIEYLESFTLTTEHHEDVDCDHSDVVARTTCGTCESSWCSVCTPTPSARCPFEYEHAEPLTEEEEGELTLLREVAKQGETFSDWTDGVTLVRYSYFERYAQEYADDMIPSDVTVSWPFTCIDWEQAAREMQMDYTTIEFDGIDYYGR